ncbi:NAD-dependent epimerase/dehydratase family protein [Rhizobium sp. NFR03]|uniref:NAD-dependent epimerase/dehydratase family protein n=1 Tax=Rhizobium sp. NFR03 TaxID=1566263 RepID=UPI0008ABCA20|nr:NAD-dependent epimerase/dehydratase family protein [Rhizobium sp. NFR03]SES33683.1 Nucleoside-diphosphate-sugar epimerase [Rhizobium sp. NFR03]
MRVLVSGATGIVGRFVVEHLLAHGHEVVAGVRSARPTLPFSRHVEATFLSLDPDATPPDFDGCDALVHAAFQHVPGRYRGGEGNDPEGFRRANLHGSVRLFEAAKQAGVRRCIFLSSRAVYGRQPDGVLLAEDMKPAPESLYGAVKWEAEQALGGLNADDFVTASLRPTGVYGLLPDLPHKWEVLEQDYLSGRPVEDRVGTEIHGDDLAAAVLLLLKTDTTLVSGRAFNASDLLTSHHDVLSELQQVTGCTHPLPRPLDKSLFHQMDTSRLRSLGWHPGGTDRFRADIAALAERLMAKP